MQRRAMTVRHRTSWRWLAVAAIVALPGCATNLPQVGQPAPPLSSEELAALRLPEPMVEPPPPPKKSPPKKAARPRPKPAAQLAHAQPQAGAAPERKEPGLAPVNLVGLDEHQLTALLGAPSEQEEPTPGKIWRYRKANCTLDITLYPDVLTRTYRSLAYEVTSNDNTAEGKRDCVPRQHVDAGTQ